MAVTLLSIPPIRIERATTETRIGLLVVHLMVLICLLPLTRTTSARRPG